MNNESECFNESEARVVSYIVFECLDIPERHELELFIWLLNRAIARALIGGGGGVYIHIFVFCPTNFF